jgi:hypothetical protein
MDGKLCGPCNTCTSCVPKKKEEHRGSRWDGLLREVASDPLLLHYVFNEFAPEEKDLLERAGGRG